LINDIFLYFINYLNTLFDVTIFFNHEEHKVCTEGHKGILIELKLNFVLLTKPFVLFVISFVSFVVKQIKNHEMRIIRNVQIDAYPVS